MSRSKIHADRTFDSLHGCDIVTLWRRSGSITIEEAIEALREEGRGYGGSTYALLLSTGDIYQGYGYTEEMEHRYDFIDLGSSEKCPICAKEEAILRWCPECGTFIRRCDI